VLPGDTVSISGGTYSTELTVGASGTASAQITIAASTEAGHNGAVIIDRNGGQDGAGVNGRNYVTIRGLNIRNISDAGIWVRSATGVVLENNSVYSGDPGGGNARGYDVRNSFSGTVVRNNSYATPASTLAQTDGIWSSNNNGVSFTGNNIVISNSSTYGHSDGIQSFQDINITIKGNYIVHPNGGLNDHGMWLSDAVAGGTITVVDNIVDMPVGDETGIAYLNQVGGSGRAVIENNTVYGSEWGVYLYNSPQSVVKNNILVPFGNQATGIVLANGTPAAANIDNNLVFGGSAGSINDSLKTWAQWQSAGFDAHGVNADPKFVNAAAHNFRLQSGSPAIDRGSTVAVTDDYAGVLRPQGSAFDIGAYESGQVVTTDTLILFLSEDRYRGDAKFIAKIDGTTIAGPTAVTTLHSSGQSQAFTFSGMWTGTHDLELSFINDYYIAGTGDRNLYVDQVKLNGVSYLTQPNALYRNETVNITIGHQ
jgi:parallel beta-helix repeat protein